MGFEGEGTAGPPGSGVLGPTMAAGDCRGTLSPPARPHWAFLNVHFPPALTQINTSIHNDDECPPKAKIMCKFLICF